ncbi:hypothetical protein HDU80_006962 [Chytriomyces hyalinus]|nr:hypothetical protein HDU80_006962 [Chytriomyces hyalinus]
MPAIPARRRAKPFVLIQGSKIEPSISKHHSSEDTTGTRAQHSNIRDTTMNNTNTETVACENLADTQPMPLQRVNTAVHPFAHTEHKPDRKLTAAAIAERLPVGTSPALDDSAQLQLQQPIPPQLILMTQPLLHSTALLAPALLLNSSSCTLNNQTPSRARIRCQTRHSPQHYRHTPETEDFIRNLAAVPDPYKPPPHLMSETTGIDDTVLNMVTVEPWASATADVFSEFHKNLHSVKRVPVLIPSNVGGGGGNGATPLWEQKAAGSGVVPSAIGMAIKIGGHPKKESSPAKRSKKAANSHEIYPSLEHSLTGVVKYTIPPPLAAYRGMQNDPTDGHLNVSLSDLASSRGKPAPLRLRGCTATTYNDHTTNSNHDESSSPFSIARIESASQQRNQQRFGNHANVCELKQLFPPIPTASSAYSLKPKWISSQLPTLKRISDCTSLNTDLCKQDHGLASIHAHRSSQKLSVSSTTLKLPDLHMQQTASNCDSRLQTAARGTQSPLSKTSPYHGYLECPRQPSATYSNVTTRSVKEVMPLSTITAISAHNNQPCPKLPSIPQFHEAFQPHLAPRKVQLQQQLQRYRMQQQQHALEMQQKHVQQQQQPLEEPQQAQPQQPNQCRSSHEESAANQKSHRDADVDVSQASNPAPKAKNKIKPHALSIEEVYCSPMQKMGFSLSLSASLGMLKPKRKQQAHLVDDKDCNTGSTDGTLGNGAVDPVLLAERLSRVYGFY